MSLTYADEAIRIKQLAPLTERDVARATGAGVSTVSAWLHQTRAPRGLRAERLVELSAIIERLAAVLDQEYVPVWLNRPLVALDHRKPIDVLASGGYNVVVEASTSRLRRWSPITLGTPPPSSGTQRRLEGRQGAYGQDEPRRAQFSGQEGRRGRWRNRKS